MPREYIDFHIQIGSLRDGGYPVSMQGPGGDATGILRLPTDDPEYRELLRRLGVMYTDEEQLARIGRRLFEELFHSKLKETFVRSQSLLKEGQGLRLVLAIDAAETQAAALPWEFLYDAEQPGPMALLDMPIMRYLPQPSPIPTLKTPLPLRVLLTGAQTRAPGAGDDRAAAEATAANIERELREIQSVLAELGDQVLIEVEQHLTSSKLLRLLRREFHIWHFVGYGSMNKSGTEGRLQFEDDAGGMRPISPQQVSILLNRSSVRLVVLNSCESGRLALDPFRSIAPALVRAQTPAVVAMQFTVPQQAARVFAGEFYRALAEGLPIDACVTEGRKALMNDTGLERPDWGIPVVYTRAPDGRLFVPAASAAPTKANERQAIDDGLLALRALMDTPDVYAAVVSGGDQFQEVLRQIERLGRYKDLHDVLQQLEDCMEVVDRERQRLPQDGRAWRRLAVSEPELYVTLSKALLLASDSPTDVPWMRKLERAQQEARAGVEQQALDLLNSAMNRIADVLGAIPWRVNAQLVAVARDLPLRALARNLTVITERMASLALEEWEARQRAVFVQGVAALEALDRRLSELVLRHDLFQQLDNELRPVEGWIEGDASNLARVWPDIQPLHAQVCDDLAAAWAPRLVATATELEQSIGNAAPQRTATIFWRYRGQVNQSFNTVDSDLLKLCEELKRLGASLEFVLRTAR